MDQSPLVVNQAIPIEMLSFLALEMGSKVIHDGFIIIDDHGEYLGVGLGEELVTVVFYMQAQKNRQLMENIGYACVIQQSFMRSAKQHMAMALSDYFLRWEARDRVGGDGYFCRNYEHGFFIALIDCTGHGVPGAFMTLIAISLFNQVLTAEEACDPAAMLAAINQKLKAELGQEECLPCHHGSNSQSDDGMSAAFCWVDKARQTLTYAGAQIPLFWLDPTTAKAQWLQPNRQGVGYQATPADYQWHNQVLKLPEGSCCYLATDGLLEQVGGDKQIAFGKKRFAELIQAHYAKPMLEQETEIMREFYGYQGKQRRRDDVCVLGFKL